MENTGKHGIYANEFTPLWYLTVAAAWLSWHAGEHYFHTNKVGQ